MKPIPIVAEPIESEHFALYPTEFGDGVVISQEEMFGLSHSYSKIYQESIAELCAQISRNIDTESVELSILARAGVVPLMHCFLDRLVRIEKAIRLSPTELAIPNQETYPPMDRIETFIEAVTVDPKFNQFLIGFIGRVWNLPEVEGVQTGEIVPAQPGFINNLTVFKSPSLYMLRKIFLKLCALIPRSRFPVLTLANATLPFRNAGFFSSHFSTLDLTRNYNLPPRDDLLRQKVFSEKWVRRESLEKFLTQLGFDDSRRGRAFGYLREFFQLYFPKALLEEIPLASRQSANLLKPYEKRRTIFSSGAGDTSESLYVFSVAKKLGFANIKFQHGGHYGYIEDLSQIVELEYPSADGFVTWGWQTLPDNPILKHLRAIPMPSPWLSERKKYWSGESFFGPREYDVLLMPSIVKRFPAPVNGAAISRRDLVEQSAGFLKEIVSTITANNIRVLHKPYTTGTAHLLAATYQKLAEIGGGKYGSVRHLNKGLNHELLRKCNMVVWDQPGTGFLECLACGIPTVLVWTRLYSREEKWSKALFSELENVNIVNSSTGALAATLLQYLENPSEWMQSKVRRAAIERFCYEYARTDDNWKQVWRDFLDCL